LPALLGIMVLAAYVTAYRAVFVLDDTKVIVNNPEIRRLWPPPQDWLRRRFLVDATFAVNYATGRLNPADYHATNVAIHVGSVLLLYALLCRTLATKGVASWLNIRRRQLAFFVAAAWGVHPLTTSAVTYTCQRYEIVMAFFYLLTLYAALRANAECGMRNAEGNRLTAELRTHPGRAGSAPVRASRENAEHSAFRIPRSAFWIALAVVSCFLGMASKEVMITAPVVVLVYDRIFLSGSFRRILRERWPLYAGLAMSWVLLGVLLATGVPSTMSGEAAEPAASQVVSYVMTEAGVIAHYLRLAFWPYPLCLDYAWPRAAALVDVVPGLAIVGTLACLTVVGLFARPRLAFPAFVFFTVLAPTSSFLPRPDYAFEHRMYLPLVGVMTLAVVGLAWILRERGVREHLAPARYYGAFPYVAAILLAGMALATARRSTVFHSQETAWRDVIGQRPGNLRARVGLIGGLLKEGRFEEAEHDARALLAAVKSGMAQDGSRRATVARNPWQTYPMAHNQVGLSLLGQGRAGEALAHFEEAVHRGRGYKSSYHLNTALALMALDRPGDAANELSAALVLEPGMIKAHVMLGKALVEMGEYRRSIESYEEALRVDPGFLPAKVELAWLLGTSPAEQDRDGERGIRLARSASESVGGRSVRSMEVLAACYAETGAYAEACEAAGRALQLARDPSATCGASDVARIEAALALYEAGRPLRLPGEQR